MSQYDAPNPNVIIPFDSLYYLSSNEYITLSYANSTYYKKTGGVISGSILATGSITTQSNLVVPLGLFTIGSTLVTSSADELNYNDITTLGTAQASKVLTCDASVNCIGINSLTSTSLLTTNFTLGGTLVTSSADELNYNDITTLGTAQASKVLTCDASVNCIGINNLTISSRYSITNNSTTIFDELEKSSLAGILLNNTSGTTGELNTTAIAFLNSTTASTIAVPSACISIVKITATDSAADLIFHTKSGVLASSRCNERMRILSNGKIAINTLVGNKQVSINNSTGDCLRLIYDNVAGTETAYADLNTDSSGNLVLVPISNTISSKSLLLSGDSTYYSLTSSTDSINARIYTTVTGTYAVNIGSYSNHQLSLMTNNVARMEITNFGFCSINTTRTNNRQLTINHSSGQCLRLIYNDSSSLWGDIWLSSIGNLSIEPYGIITTTKSIEITSDTHGYQLISSSTSLGYTMDFSIYHNVSSGKTYIDSSSIHNVVFRTDNYDAITFNSDSSVGFDTISTSRQVNINHTTGNCLRLIYNNTNGTENKYGDIDILATGEMQLSSITGYIDLQGLKINTIAVTSSATELNYNDITTLGTAQASKVLTCDASVNCIGINSLTSTSLLTTNFTLGGTLVTSSATELNYNDITTLGTAQASKVLTCDASINCIGINEITANTVTGTQLNAGSDTGQVADVLIAAHNTSLANNTYIYFTYGKSNTVEFEMAYKTTDGANTGSVMSFGFQGAFIMDLVAATGSLDMRANNDFQVEDTGYYKCKSNAGGNTITWTNDAGNSKLALNSGNYHQITSSTTSAAVLRLLAGTSDYLDLGYVSSAYRITTSTTSNLVVSSSNDANQIFLKTSGEVGINNSSPVAQLDVTGTITSSSTITGATLISSGTVTGTQLYAGSNTAQGSDVLLAAHNTSLANDVYNFWTFGKSNSVEFEMAYKTTDGTNNGGLMAMGFQGSSILYIQASGSYVGIGTVPSYPFHVSGYVNSSSTSNPAEYFNTSSGGDNWNSTAYGNVSAYFSHRLVAQGYIGISDIRRKTNIIDLSEKYCISFIEKMKAKSFNFKNDLKNTCLGFIAQDALKNGFSNIVTYLDEEGMDELIDEDGFKSPKDIKMGISYQDIIPINSKNIEMLYNENKKMKDEIKDMKILLKELDEIVARIDLVKF